MIGLKQSQTFLNRLLVQGQTRYMSGAAASIRSRFEEAYVERRAQVAARPEAM